MKPIQSFYDKVCDLIETGVPGAGTGTYPARAIEVDLISLSGRARESKNPVSWVGAENANILSMMLRCVNDPSNANDKAWEMSVETLLTSAFKDMSSLREVTAIDTFNRLRRVCFMNKEEHFIWSRKTVKRDDGSAVLVIHTSSLRAFNSLFYGKSAKGSLEEGMIIQK